MVLFGSLNSRCSVLFWAFESDLSQLQLESAYDRFLFPASTRLVSSFAIFGDLFLIEIVSIFVGDKNIL